MMVDPSGHGWSLDDFTSWVDDTFIQPVVHTTDNAIREIGRFGQSAGEAIEDAYEDTQQFVRQATPNEIQPYVGSVVGGVVSAFMSPIAGGVIGGMTSSFLAGGSMLDVSIAGGIGGTAGALGMAPVVGSSLAGGFTGAAYATIYGGDVWESTWQGAAVGAAGGWAGTQFGDAQTVGSELARAATVGASTGAAYAMMNGGNMITGMTRGAAVGFGTRMGTMAIQDPGTILSMLSYGANVLTTDVYAFAVGQANYIRQRASDFDNLGSALLSGDPLRAARSLAQFIHRVLIPAYGRYGGAGIGREQYTPETVDPLNKQDWANWRHDNSRGNHLGWIVDSYSSSTPGLSTGPLGTAYKLLGTPLFSIAGGVRELIK